jgi:arylesterase/paraoxonase
MRKTLKIVGIILGVVLVVAIARLLYMLNEFNAFRTLAEKPLGQCVKLYGTVGNEDVVYDGETGLAYVSATDRARKLPGSVDGIYSLDVKAMPDPSAKLEYRPVKGLEDFHPHGLDLRRLDNGTLRLFAVNHTKDGRHFIELIDITGEGLVHVKSVGDPLIISPNDVVSVGPEQFYTTNDKMRAQQGPMLFVLLSKLFLPHELTTVVFWDGEKARVAASGFDNANGINASPDGKEIYVNEYVGKTFSVFARDESNELRLVEKIPLEFAADNISVSPDGRIFAAGNASIYRTMIGRRLHGGQLPPSEAVEITRMAEGPSKVEQIYMNKGEEIPALTVLQPLADNMFALGNPQDDIFVICRKE